VLPGFEFIQEAQLLVFALILVRVTAFVMALPAFGTVFLPGPVRLFFAISLAIFLFPLLQKSAPDISALRGTLIWLVIVESAVGLLLGFLFRFFFFAINIAGELIGISSGLASAQIFNPGLGANVNVFEQLHFVLAIIFLLALNGHHLFIKGLAQSYSAVPLAFPGIKLSSLSEFAALISMTFTMGLKMAAPVVVAVFMANLAMGVVGRAVPQINVLMTGMQVTILVTLLVVFTSIPFFVEELGIWLGDVSDNFFRLMRVI
jgi:flagellar biosynthetic protein FliR